MALESSHCIHMPLTFKNKLTQNLRLSSSPVNLRKGKCDIGGGGGVSNIVSITPFEAFLKIH